MIKTDNLVCFLALKLILKKKNMNIKPLGDRVVIKPIAEDITTKSGIVLPETVEKEKAEKGEVLAVGPGRVLDNGNLAPMSVKVGNKVMFKKYSPDEIKVDGEELLIISEQDILAIV
jgi:chaperonin GroES